MILGRLHCANHPQNMCECNPVIRDGISVHWPQEKCYSSDALSRALYETPFLVTSQTLPGLLRRISDHDDIQEMKTQVMALGHLIRTFPMPLWLYDADVN
jgi:hypothetical protein